MKNINKSKLLIILFVVVFIGIFFLLKTYKDNEIDGLLNEQAQSLEISYKQGLDRFNVIATNVYMSLQNDKDFVAIVSQTNNENLQLQHKKLDSYLQEEFSRLKQLGIMGLQIVLPNNLSVIRLHKTDKFGDNLTQTRYALNYVNQTKMHISGFEEGRTSHAFREVYPLYSSGHHIGAVEILFSSTMFQDYTMRALGIHTHFIVNKNVFKFNAWKSNHNEPYEQSIEHKDFLSSLNDHINHTRLDVSKRMVIFPLQEKIDNGIATGEKFTIYKKLEKIVKIISFMPVKRIKDNKTVAYLVSYTESDKLFKTLSNFNISIIVLIIILLATYFTMYRFMRVKEGLETELKYDDLTKVYNRKYFRYTTQEAFNSLNIQNSDFTIVMIDIDYFKNVNDSCGHQCGDSVLIELSQLLKSSIRSVDKVARYGGEEFIMCLNTNEEYAFKIVENIRQEIEKLEFSEQKLKITASFGVAQYKNDVSLDDIIRRADDALYLAKEKGRNQTQRL